MKIDYLKNIKVLLIGHYIPTPLAAYLLSALGAEIIKVEPITGDLFRLWTVKDVKNKNRSIYFEAYNCGFKSVSVNLKTIKGAGILKDLIKISDVFFDGNRTGFIEKCIGGTVSEINSDIVYIPITAYGLTGKMKNNAGHDNNILAKLGLLSFNSIASNGNPSVSGTQIADIMSGCIAAFMAVSALYGKKNVNSNVNIDTIDASMLHAASIFTQMYVPELSLRKQNPKPEKEKLNGGNPKYCVYSTKDNESVFFGALEPKLFKKFAEKIERKDILILKSKPKLKKELTSIFLSKTKREWDEISQNCDCCLTPVNYLKEVLSDNQLTELEIFKNIKKSNSENISFFGFPAGFTKKSVQPDIEYNVPKIGENTLEILKEYLNYSESQIEKLVKSKTVKFPDNK